MGLCAICDSKLTFWNTPVFGSGKLSSGDQVCSSCFRNINNVNPSVASNLNNYKLADIERLFRNADPSYIDLSIDPLEEVKTKLEEMGIDATPENIRKQVIKELGGEDAEETNRKPLPDLDK